MTNLTYQPNGDYLLPNLTAEPTSRTLGKYGRMRRTFLKEKRPILFNSYTVTGKLHSHLLEIEDTAQERLTQMMPELMKTAGVTEELKASNPLLWTSRMNTLKAQAEEVLLTELIYA